MSKIISSVFGKNVTVDLDILTKLLKEEIQKVIDKCLSEKKYWQQLTPETIESKKRKGYIKPDQQMYATGALLDSIEVVKTSDTSLVIKANKYFVYNWKKFNFLPDGLIRNAFHKACERYIKEGHLLK